MAATAVSAVPSPPCLAEGHRAEPEPLLRGHDRWHGVAGEFSVVRCADCGMAGTVPRLHGAELGRYYPSDYYTHAAPEAPEALGGLRGAVTRALETARRRLYERFGPFRDLYAGTPGRLLDVGCGNGELAAGFVDRGWRAAGIEISADAAAAAAAGGLEVHHGTIHHAPWEDGSFDAVIFNHALEHVDDPGADLRAAGRLVRPGGLVVVSVPNFGGWQRRAFGTRWFQLDLPRHLTHFDTRSLPALGERAGLHVARVSTTPSLQSLPGSLQYVLKGRMVWPALTLYRLGYLLWPLALPLDLAWGGDCLHVVWRRSDG
jgi:SAM-dependent methyltransferase